MTEANYLNNLASLEVPKAEITEEELEEKEAFRKHLESICREALVRSDEGSVVTIDLVGFGSLASGFATPGSDMDLAVIPKWQGPCRSHETFEREVPRILEKAVLDAKMGGRLLTRTRVPILKVCQHPTEELYKALADERQKWDSLPDEEKYNLKMGPEPSPKTPAHVGPKSTQIVHNADEFPTIQEAKAAQDSFRPAQPKSSDSGQSKISSPKSPAESDEPKVSGNEKTNDGGSPREQSRRNDRQWMREKALGPLDFPKTGVGIQCDLNFSNPLGIQNTHLLRCYSLCDPRVRPMVLFVKAWAKRRKINSSYSGTLSSYGWVLMVLHYLVNIAQPPVCPNLQLCWQPPSHINAQDLEQMFRDTMIGGYVVRFWREEAEIMEAASSGQLTRNGWPLGALLRQFFQYFASCGGYPSFYWTTEVLALRNPGGIRTKLSKGWTGAKTTISKEGKEVRQRYLFCIEDPFEHDHNVARTVTHNGIVAIRDEFRRAWRIINAIGTGQQPEGDLFDEVIEQIPPLTPKNAGAEQTSVSSGNDAAVAAAGAQSHEETGNTAQKSRAVVDAAPVPAGAQTRNESGKAAVTSPSDRSPSYTRAPRRTPKSKRQKATTGASENPKITRAGIQEPAISGFIPQDSPFKSQFQGIKGPPHLTPKARNPRTSGPRTVETAGLQSNRHPDAIAAASPNSPVHPVE